MPVSFRQGMHILVSGRVQGVGYRAWTERTAQNLGVLGWVRNLPDGAVEIRCEGEVPVLRRFVEFLKEGPPLAVVSDVIVSEEPSGERYSDFSVRR